MCGGVVAASLSHPMDTIKTCMQGDIAKTTYTSLTGTAQTILKEVPCLERLLHGKEKKKGFVGSYAGADGVAPPLFFFFSPP